MYNVVGRHMQWYAATQMGRKLYDVNIATISSPSKAIFMLQGALDRNKMGAVF